MNLEYLKLFARLAHTQNISKAGKELGLSPAVASNYINKLEQSLGCRLLHRTTRQVSLTEEGKAFLPHAQDILSQVEMARASVGVGQASINGTLRIAAPASFARMHIIPNLADFLKSHPNLNIDLRLSDTIVDLVEGGFDVAIRNAHLDDSSFIAKKLTTDHRMITASPEYIQAYGKPNTPEDLKHHQCVNLIGLDNWTFKTASGPISIKTTSRLCTDNGEAMRDACVSSMGLAINSTWSAYKHLRQGTLIQVLEDYPLISDTDIWAIYPSSRLLAVKVRAFIDYFTPIFGNTPYWDE